MLRARPERRCQTVLENKKYNIIYADPPWKYDRNKVQGAAEKHYSTMTVDDLCKLPVADMERMIKLLQ